MGTDVAELVRTARLDAGLTQRALATRAGTTQSVVARIELGEVSPTWATVNRLLDAAGFALDVHLVRLAIIDERMHQEVARILALTPEERLSELRDLDRDAKRSRSVSR